MALKTRNNLAQRNTLTPSGGMTPVAVKMASTILHITTKQSKRLKRDTKYPWKPRLYILRNISNVNNTMKNKLATSANRNRQNSSDVTKLLLLVYFIFILILLVYFSAGSWSFDWFHRKKTSKEKGTKYKTKIIIYFMWLAIYTDWPTEWINDDPTDQLTA